MTLVTLPHGYSRPNITVEMRVFSILFALADVAGKPQRRITESRIGVCPGLHEFEYLVEGGTQS
jgi:hypothetical protein